MTDQTEPIEFAQHVTTEELDEAVRLIRKCTEDYEAKSAIAKDAHFQLEHAKKTLTDLLVKAGKSKYDAEGIGKVAMVNRLSVKFPKDLNDRKSLMEWLRGKMGDEGVLTYFTINSQTLNSLYKEQFEHAKLHGDAATLTIPGLDEPTAALSVRFNRTR